MTKSQAARIERLAKSIRNLGDIVGQQAEDIIALRSMIKVIIAELSSR